MLPRYKANDNVARQDLHQRSPVKWVKTDRSVKSGARPIDLTKPCASPAKHSPCKSKIRVKVSRTFGKSDRSLKIISEERKDGRAKSQRSVVVGCELRGALSLF